MNIKPCFNYKQGIYFPKCLFVKQMEDLKNIARQAGAELGQAQLQLELGFTVFKVCCIILMISKYHYISLSTMGLSLASYTYLHTSLHNCYLPCLLACLLTYFPISRLSTSYLLAIYMTNYKLHLYFPRWWGWVVIIKLKAYISSDWTGTELGNKLN